MGEYSHIEIFNEIIHFMDLAFPEWSTNKGVGFWAAEFVLTAIQNLEHLYEESGLSSFEVLKELYLNLVCDYKNYKSQFSFALSDSILNDFEIEHDELLDENEHLSKEDYKVFYDKIYNAYQEKYLNKVTYVFLDTEFPII